MSLDRLVLHQENRWRKQVACLPNRHSARVKRYLQWRVMLLVLLMLLCWNRCLRSSRTSGRGRRSPLDELRQSSMLLSCQRQVRRRRCIFWAPVPICKNRSGVAPRRAAWPLGGIETNRCRRCIRTGTCWTPYASTSTLRWDWGCERSWFVVVVMTARVRVMVE